MTGNVRNWFFAPVVALILAFAAGGPAAAQDIAAAEKTAATKHTSKRSGQVSSAGHVYLLRGLLNIFSLGMDDLAAKIQARGITASVHNHSEWQTLADSVAAKYKAGNRGPIILVGHSLGADAVMFMGEYLGKKGVPVALIVPFDGTGSFAASSNVARVMNLTQRDYAHMRRGAGFRGELANIDLSNQGVGHIDIDKSARLHAMVLNKIQAVLGRGGRSQTAGDGGAPTPRVRPAAEPAEPGASAAPKPPAADAAPAAPKPAPGTTASTSGLSSDRAGHAPAAEKPAAPPAESSASRSNSDAASKPAVRF